MSFLKDFTKANQDVNKFLNFINSMTKDGKELIEIESTDNNILQMFDKFSGVDAIQITKDNQIRGVAMRVQYGNAWNTFTIRYKRTSGAKTEYEKRVEALKNEKAYPHLTVQCYLSNDGNEILSVGIIRTRDLYEQIEKYPHIRNFRKAGEDGNIFLWVSFKKLSNILVYEKANNSLTFYGAAA